MIEKIIDVLLNYVEVDGEITAETDIKKDLGMSSFDLVCFANELKDEFGVKLGVDDFRGCITVGKLADRIAKG